MSKRYWFYIDSYIYISVKKGNALLYNPYNGKFLEYSSNQTVLKLISRLQSPRNLRVIPMTEEELSKPAIREFAKEIREYFMGDLVDTEFSEGKPVQMPPLLKIQKDVKYLKKIRGRSVGESLLKYIDEISIHLTNHCKQACHICTGAYRQFFCCCSNKEKKYELDVHHLLQFLEELKGTSPVHLNITGGDTGMYPKLQLLGERLENLNFIQTYLIHYLNLAGPLEGLKYPGTQNVHIKILISFPVDEDKLNVALKRIKETGVDFTLFFIVEGIDDVKKAEYLLSKHPDKNPALRAYYNGNNLDFFRKNMYIDREKIANARPSLRDIYINESINPLYFGKLTILADGSIYAGVNRPRLGMLGKDSIYDVLIKEMNSGGSWRKIRKNVVPCKSCVFEKLCPPISDYNKAIGKFNLCHEWR
jgi:pseudo-rSAM protein